MEAYLLASASVTAVLWSHLAIRRSDPVLNGSVIVTGTAPKEHRMPRYVEITEDEAWAIDLTVRHTHVESGEAVGQELLLKAMYVILEFEDRRAAPLSPLTLPIALTEEECWALDHQVRCDLTINNKNVGRGLLLKVFRALTEFASERDAIHGVAQLSDLAGRLRGEFPADGVGPSESGAQPRLGEDRRRDIPGDGFGDEIPPPTVPRGK